MAHRPGSPAQLGPINFFEKSGPARIKL
jgi:hypothetical protein